MRMCLLIIKKKCCHQQSEDRCQSWMVNCPSPQRSNARRTQPGVSKHSQWPFNWLMLDRRYPRHLTELLPEKGKQGFLVW